MLHYFTVSKVSVLVYKYLHGSAPSYLVDKQCMRTSRPVGDSVLPLLHDWSSAALDSTWPFRLPLLVSGTVDPSTSLLHLRCLSSGNAWRLICLLFPVPVPDHVQCSHSDTCHFGHFNRSCYLLIDLLTYSCRLRTRRNVLLAIGVVWIGMAVINTPILTAYSSEMWNVCLPVTIATARRIFIAFFVCDYLLPLAIIGFISVSIYRHITVHGMTENQNATRWVPVRWAQA